MALNVLHHWQEFPICGTALVPEHVEQRPLFNSSRPGLEQVFDFTFIIKHFRQSINKLLSIFQGKLELWIDMFGVDDLPPRPAIDIRPKPPEDYELRVIIWNTEDVPLVDNQFLTGEKCSDLYVKGWVFGIWDKHFFLYRLSVSGGWTTMTIRGRTFTTTHWPVRVTSTGDSCSDLHIWGPNRWCWSKRSFRYFLRILHHRNYLVDWTSRSGTTIISHLTTFSVCNLTRSYQRGDNLITGN